MPNGFYKSNYNYQTALNKLNEDQTVSKQIKDSIIELTNRLIAENISGSRIKKYVQILHIIAGIVGKKSFKDYTQKDFEKVLANINQRNLSPHTKNDYKIVIKRFMKFYEGENYKQEKYSWIKTTIKKNEMVCLMYNDLITKEEINELIKSTQNPMYKCLISLGYWSAMRPSEMLSLTINSIKFEDGYTQISIPESKTVKRIIFVREPDGYIKTWLNTHPLKEDPTAPLFISNSVPYKEKKYLIPESYNKMLKVLAKRVGIKKRVYGYLLRHSRITHMIEEGWNEIMIKKQCGHVTDSKAFKVYEHLSEKQLKEHFISMNEKQKIANKGKPKEEIECNICHTVNPITNDFCLHCARPVTNAAVMKHEVERNTINDFFMTFVKRVMEHDPALQKIAVQVAKEKGIADLLEADKQ